MLDDNPMTSYIKRSATHTAVGVLVSKVSAFVRCRQHIFALYDHHEVTYTKLLRDHYCLSCVTVVSRSIAEDQDEGSWRMSWVTGQVARVGLLENR